jgi:uncharacterized membrane protein
VFERRPHLLRDLAAYVSISIAVVAVVIFCAEEGWGAGWGRWILLALFTCMIAHYWVKACRPIWRQAKFWYTSFSLLSIHIAFWILLMRRFPEFEPTWITALLEIAGLPFIADFIQPLLGHPRKPYNGAKLL